MPEESGAVNPFRKSIDDFLSTATPGLEEVVNSKSFGAMLSQTAGNLVALQRIGNEMTDLALRNARIASKADVTSLQRQLARTEDKLELVLESAERLEDELADERRRSAESADRSKEGESATSKRSQTSNPAGRGGRSSSDSSSESDDQGE